MKIQRTKHAKYYRLKKKYARLIHKWADRFEKMSGSPDWKEAGENEEGRTVSFRKQIIKKDGLVFTVLETKTHGERHVYKGNFKEFEDTRRVVFMNVQYAAPENSYETDTDLWVDA